MHIKFSGKEIGASCCPACVRRRHGDCSRHINDGAVDAEEFIGGLLFDCSCPCGGRVPEGGQLIDLVEALVYKIKLGNVRVETLYAELQEERKKLQRAHKILHSIIDDEGNADMRAFRQVLSQFGVIESEEENK